MKTQPAKPHPTNRQTMTKAEAWRITLESLKDEGIALIDDTASAETDDRQFNAAIRQMFASEPRLVTLAAQHQEQHIRQMQQTLAESAAMLQAMHPHASTRQP